MRSRFHGCKFLSILTSLGAAVLVGRSCRAAPGWSPTLPGGIAILRPDAAHEQGSCGRLDRMQAHGSMLRVSPGPRTDESQDVALSPRLMRFGLPALRWFACPRPGPRRGGGRLMPRRSSASSTSSRPTSFRCSAIRRCSRPPMRAARCSRGGCSLRRLARGARPPWRHAAGARGARRTARPGRAVSCHGAPIDARDLAGAHRALGGGRQRTAGDGRAAARQGRRSEPARPLRRDAARGRGLQGQRPHRRALLAHGADPKRVDTTGKAPILYAAARGFAPLVRRLLDAGVDARRLWQRSDRADVGGGP